MKIYHAFGKLPADIRNEGYERGLQNNKIMGTDGPRKEAMREEFKRCGKCKSEQNKRCSSKFYILELNKGEFK
jgi:hypothetical protein